MLSPALATQYSLRLTLANVLETEVMKTICGSVRVAACVSLSMANATGLSQEKRPFQADRAAASRSRIVESRDSRSAVRLLQGNQAAPVG